MASILVIDDDRAVLATVKILLERAAHAVEAVDNSRTGLQLIEARSFDLLIVDIFMPGMDGFETMKLVHQSRPQMPVIVISGQQFRLASDRQPDFLHMATRLGAVSSLQKPFRPFELLAAVNGSLSSSQLPPGLQPKNAGGHSLRAAISTIYHRLASFLRWRRLSRSLTQRASASLRREPRDAGVWRPKWKQRRPQYFSLDAACHQPRPQDCPSASSSSRLFSLPPPFPSRGCRCRRFPAFVASYQSALAINDLITAILLLSQFSLLRSRALLLLASGYLFTAAAAVVHGLTFPNLFATQRTFQRRPADHGLALHDLARRFPALRARLRPAQGRAMAAAYQGIGRAHRSSGRVIAVFATMAVVDLRRDGTARPSAALLITDKGYAPALFGTASTVWLLNVAALLVLWLRRPHSRPRHLAHGGAVRLAVRRRIVGAAQRATIRSRLLYRPLLWACAPPASCWGCCCCKISTCRRGCPVCSLACAARAPPNNERHSERERLFSAVVESSNDAIITKTLDGTITGWNPAAERLFGYTAAEAIGDHIDLIVPPEGLRRVARYSRARRPGRDRRAS